MKLEVLNEWVIDDQVLTPDHNKFNGDMNEDDLCLR